MLNEKIEYAQYSFDVKQNESAHNARLQYRYLCKGDKDGNVNFSGLERAMIIVARSHMFNLENKNVDHASFVLQAWCGTKNTCEELKEDPIYDWLNKYIKYCLLAPRIEEIISKGHAEDDDSEKVYVTKSEWLPHTIYNLLLSVQNNFSDSTLSELSEQLQETPEKDWENVYSKYITPIIRCVSALMMISGKRKQFGHSMFEQAVEIKGAQQNSFNNKNDYKTITYDKILAEASNLGPLKEYYLLLDNPQILSSLSTTSKEIDWLLKTVSAYLLSKSYASQRYVAVNWTDIYNWQSNTKDDDFRAWRNKLRFNKEPAFTSVTEANQAKLSICPSFIEHFKIVDAADMEQVWNEYKSANKKAVFYKDKGSYFHLVKLEEYTKNE